MFICLTVCLVVGKQYRTCTDILTKESDSRKKNGKVRKSVLVVHYNSVFGAVGE